MTDPTPRSVVEVRALAAWVGRKVKTLAARLDGAVQDDDPRLSDARTPTAHRHDAADIDNLPTGGGGAGIDDGVIAPTSTWSSEKIAADRSPMKWFTELRMFGGDRGSPVDTGMTLTNGVDMAFETAMSTAEALGTRMYVVDLTGTLTGGSEVTIVAAGSGTILDPGRLYAIRAADGIITWRLPS